MKKSVRGLALLSTAALALSMGTAGSADASQARATGQQVLAKGIPSPLSLAVAKDGSAYVTSDFAGMLWHVAKGQAPDVVYTAKEKGALVGGVSRHKNTITFAITGTNKVVKQMKNGGKPYTLADVGKYEATKNPDQGQTYGIENPTPGCEAQWPTDADSPPITYTGIVDSHPYATYTTGEGVYLGEAGGNDILWIGNDGKIKTVAVLPPTSVTITPEAAKELGVPACAGLNYLLEPVPTDVELGPDGWLYVSSLPGGPESAVLGFNGRVYKVNPKTGKVKVLAGGFLSSVDLAVANNGDVYVAELFTGAVKRIKAGKNVAKPFLQLTQPGAIEWTKDYLYATDNALIGQANPKGKVIRIKW